MAKRIDVKDVNIYYGSFKAVEDVSMTIEPRSVTAFIGPSGCGKSTVLRTLNRMHEVIPGARVEGKVVLDGKDLYASSVDPVAVRRTIGMVFQRPNPFPTMSIFDNVVAGTAAQRRAQQEDARPRSSRGRCAGANLWDEVKDRLDKPGAGLSGGQQQRLCIARAIAVEPQVLLMDEPCSALDPISTLAIEDLISELKQHYTIVIVTHNMQQAARVSDRTAFFNLAGTGKPGQLIEMDDTHEDLQQPHREGHRGLHLRPLRLILGSGGRQTPPSRSSPNSAAAASPQASGVRTHATRMRRTTSHRTTRMRPPPRHPRSRPSPCGWSRSAPRERPRRRGRPRSSPAPRSRQRVQVRDPAAEGPDQRPTAGGRAQGEEPAAGSGPRAGSDPGSRDGRPRPARGRRRPWSSARPAGRARARPRRLRPNARS